MNQSNPTVLWDFDGTLVDMPGLYRTAMITVLNECEPSHKVVAEQVRPYLRAGFPWHKPEEPHLHLTTAEAWWKNLEIVFTHAYQGVGFDEKRAQEFAKQVRKHIIDPHRFVIYEDTIPALKQLKEKGWKQGILSNHVPELPDIVKELGLSSYFDFCITSAKIGYEKPNPNAFHIALDWAGNPDKVWMVGDNIIADIKGAEAVGISAILVRSQKSTDAKYYAPDLLEAVRIITGNV